MGGDFATIYLSPRDYHRVHAPLGGTLREMVYVPGRLFSVNQSTAENVPELFARNERVVCLFDTERGPMAVVLVGAMIVASIETVWAGLVTPPKRELKTFRYDEAARAPISLEKALNWADSSWAPPPSCSSDRSRSAGPKASPPAARSAWASSRPARRGLMNRPGRVERKPATECPTVQGSHPGPSPIHWQHFATPAPRWAAMGEDAARVRVNLPRLARRSWSIRATWTNRVPTCYCVFLLRTSRTCPSATPPRVT